MMYDQIQKDLLSVVDLNKFPELKEGLKVKEKIFREEIIEYFLKNYKAKVEI